MCHLKIKGLLRLTSGVVADMINGKTPYKIHMMLNIENDFTLGQDDEIHREREVMKEFILLRNIIMSQSFIPRNNRCGCLSYYYH